MDFWSNTLLLMDKREVKQKDVALATGHSSGRVCDWINRKIVPKADDAVKIADLLGTSVEYLVTGNSGKELAPLLKDLVDAAAPLSDEELAYFIGQIKSYKDMDNRKRGGTSPGSSDLREA